jgi:hypothetical protein
MMASKVGMNVRSAFAKWSNKMGVLKLSDLEKTFKFAACAARLAGIYQNFYLATIALNFRKWKNNPAIMYRRALRTIIDRTFAKMQLSARVWLQKSCIMRDKQKYEKVYNCLKTIEDGNKRLLKKGFARWGKTGKRKMFICLKNCGELWSNGMRNFFRRWIRQGNMLAMKQHGDRIKAFFIMKQYMKKTNASADGVVAEAFFKIYMLSIKF